MVRLHLLGALGLSDDDGREVRPVLAQPKRFALLAYLALAEPRGPQRRDALVARFWGEQPEAQARASLRRSLHFLRQHLGDGVIVSRGEEEVAVAADRLWCDALELERLVAAGERAEALALYRGDFLAGFFVSQVAPELEEWIERTRQRYREAAFAAAGALSDAEAAANNLSPARFWARRALDLSPLSEPAALRMIRVLERAGERTAALALYDDFARQLDQQLGVEPEPSLRAEARALRTRRPSVDDPTRYEPPNAPLVEPPNAEPPVAAPAPRAPRPRERPSLSWAVAAAALTLAALGATWMVVRRPAPAAPVLAVGALTVAGGADSSGIAATLPELVATGLGAVRDVQVISRGRLYEVEGQLGEQTLAPAALLRAARYAGASRLVEGEVYPQPAGLRLDLRLVDLRAGTVERSYRLRAATAFALADSAVARLADALRREPPTERVADLRPASLPARRYFDEGLRAFYRGDLAAADALFGLAVGEDSAYALALYFAARTREESGAPRREVLTLARRALDALGTARGGRYGRLLVGAYWASINQDPSARALADSLLAAYPHEPQAYILAGRELSFAADHAGMLGVYRRLLALDSLSLLTPLSPRPGPGRATCHACVALNGIASAYAVMDSLEAALATLERLARLRPHDRAAWISEVSLLSLLGRHDEALRLLEARADSVGATAGDVMGQRATLALGRGDFAEADRAIAGLLALTGEDLRAGLWLGFIVDRAQGRSERARREAARLDGLMPQVVRATETDIGPVVRAQTLLEDGEPRRAAAVFDSLRQRWRLTDSSTGHEARQHAWVLAHEVGALAAAGDTAVLARLADTLALVGARSSYARDQRMHHYAAGLLWDARGRPAEAIAEYERAMTSLVFGYTRINLRLAADLLATGRARDAATVLRRALRSGYESNALYVAPAELHELLARACESLGEPDSAAAHYRWVAAAWKGGAAPYRERARRAGERAVRLERR